jgi:hypothetical protein
MPTGYTAKLCDEGQSFEEFVWTCARAMGFMIHMRDDSLNTPIYRADSSSAYDTTKHHREGIEKAKQELTRIKQMSDTEVRRKLKAENEKKTAEYEESVIKQTAVCKRLDEMRAHVEAWQPPNPEFDNFKKFMLQQLDETIKWDGGLPDPPTLTTSVSKWRTETLKSWQRNLEYHEKYLAEDQGRNKDRNKWMDELDASVPIPTSMKAS